MPTRTLALIPHCALAMLISSGCVDSRSSATDEAVDPTAAAKAALRVASCFPDDSPSDGLRSIYYRMSSDPMAPKRTEIECLGAQSNACAALVACSGVSVTFDPSCRQGSGCDGDVVTSCDNPLSVRLDCRKRGLTCKGGHCVADGAAACTWKSYEQVCDSGHPTFCVREGVRKGLNCGDLGLECVVENNFGSKPQAQCRGLGKTCSANSFGSQSLRFTQGLSCSAGKLTVCLNGAEHEIACSTLGKGFSCQQVDGAAFCGIAAECDPTSSTVEALRKCVGNQVEFCNAGKLARIDCIGLGFTKCVKTTKLCGPGPYGS